MQRRARRRRVASLKKRLYHRVIYRRLCHQTSWQVISAEVTTLSCSTYFWRFAVPGDSWARLKRVSASTRRAWLRLPITPAMTLARCTSHHSDHAVTYSPAAVTSIFRGLLSIPKGSNRTGSSWGIGCRRCRRNHPRAKWVRDGSQS